MKDAIRRLRASAAWPRASQALACEQGQAMTEYGLISFFLILGGGVSLLVFIPNAIAAYKIYINSFYVILGMPFP